MQGKLEELARGDGILRQFLDHQNKGRSQPPPRELGSRHLESAQTRHGTHHPQKVMPSFSGKAE